MAIALPKQSNLKLWINSSNVISSGGKVSQVTDLSTYHNNMVQATSTAQPTVIAGTLNNNPTIRFTTSQWMESASNPILDSDVVTYFLVSSALFVTSRGMDGYGAGWGLGEYANNQSNVVRNSTLYQITDSIIGLSNLITTSQIQSSNLYHKINGGNIKSITTPTTPIRQSTRNWFLGYGMGLYSGKDFYELIIYNTVLTNVEMVQIETYLSNKYNIPIAAYDYTLIPSKTLIKANGNYYSIKPAYYNTTSKTYNPLTLAGGTVPNTADITNYGFDSVAELLTYNTINSETFLPADKMFSSYSIQKYKPK